MSVSRLNEWVSNGGNFYDEKPPSEIRCMGLSFVWSRWARLALPARRGGGFISPRSDPPNRDIENCSSLSASLCATVLHQQKLIANIFRNRNMESVAMTILSHESIPPVGAPIVWRHYWVWYQWRWTFIRETGWRKFQRETSVSDDATSQCYISPLHGEFYQSRDITIYILSTSHLQRKCHLFLPKPDMVS